MIGFIRLQVQFHAGFGRCLVALHIVAVRTGAYHVFPTVAAAPRFWDDMVNCEGNVASPAIDTTERISPQNVLSREYNPFVRN